MVSPASPVVGDVTSTGMHVACIQTAERGACTCTEDPLGLRGPRQPKQDRKVMLDQYMQSLKGMQGNDA